MWTRIQQDNTIPPTTQSVIEISNYVATTTGIQWVMFVILQIPAAESNGRRAWVRRRGPTTLVSKVVIIWLRSTENNEKHNLINDDHNDHYT
jgi:hypothetical protein